MNYTNGTKFLKSSFIVFEFTEQKVTELRSSNIVTTNTITEVLMLKKNAS